MKRGDFELNQIALGVLIHNIFRYNVWNIQDQGVLRPCCHPGEYITMPVVNQFAATTNRRARFMQPVVLGLFALVLASCAETQLAIHAAKTVIKSQTDEKTPLETTAREVPGKGANGVPIGSGGVYKVGQPYDVAGVRYYPKEDPDYDKTGIASWYGDPFHGRRTANGEIYDMNELTAAHKTLPMPVYVRVTNLENGRALVLRLNDRGPFVNGRIIDISRRGAQLLGFHKQGTAKVRVEVIASPSDTRRVLARSKITDEERKAVKAVPQGEVSVEELPPPAGMATAPAEDVKTAANIPAGPVSPSDGVRQTAVPGNPSVFIQAGAFRLYENALKLQAQLNGVGPTEITSVRVDGLEYFRVRIGPMATVETADQTLDGMIDSGYKLARIVID
jgi:rare lipoprotein A